MHRDPTARFSDRVEAYIKYRPGYPDEAVDWMLQAAGLAWPADLADVGSGTGIFTGLLLARGHRVFAVEPNPPMRAAAEAAYAEHAGFVSVHAAAEATSLQDNSVDFVCAAQAFHWFDHDAVRNEFARILRPGGKAALVWNDRVTTGDPFHVAYDSFIKAFATDYERVNHQNLGRAAFDRFFVGGWESQSFNNAQHLDLDGLIGRVESSSYMPGPGHAKHPAMLDALRRLFGRYAANGRVSIAYQTTVHIGQVV